MMNERIEKLIKKAGFSHMPKFCPNRDDFPVCQPYLYKGTGEDFEKFAKLIVRECINTIPTDMDTQEYYKAMRAIKDTFGVES